MAGVLLFTQMPDASDKRSVTLPFRPINCFFLCLESAEHMPRVVFHYIVLYGRPFWAALRTRFNIHVGHSNWILASPDLFRQNVMLDRAALMRPWPCIVRGPTSGGA